jgi:hypothetical protein
MFVLLFAEFVRFFAERFKNSLLDWDYRRSRERVSVCHRAVESGAGVSNDVGAARTACAARARNKCVP